MPKQTTQTKPPKLFQLPLNPEEAERSQEVKDKIALYKLLHKKHSLFEALEEILEIVERAETK